MALNSFNRAALSVFAAVAAAIFVVGAIYAYDNRLPPLPLSRHLRLHRRGRSSQWVSRDRSIRFCLPVYVRLAPIATDIPHCR
jgi:hypothetical protein